MVVGEIEVGSGIGTGAGSPMVGVEIDGPWYGGKPIVGPGLGAAGKLILGEFVSGELVLTTSGRFVAQQVSINDKYKLSQDTILLSSTAFEI